MSFFLPSLSTVGLGVGAPLLAVWTAGETFAHVLPAIGIYDTVLALIILIVAAFTVYPLALAGLVFYRRRVLFEALRMRAGRTIHVWITGGILVSWAINGTQFVQPIVESWQNISMW